MTRISTLDNVQTFISNSLNPLGTVLAVRPYCTNEHYWQVYFDTNRVIRETFGEAGFPPAEQPIFVRTDGSPSPCSSSAPPTTRRATRERRDHPGRRHVVVASAPPAQERIIVRSILNRDTAFSACGWCAGMRIMSPARSR